MSYYTNMCSSCSFLFITTVILQRYMVIMQPWGMFLPPNWSPLSINASWHPAGPAENHESYNRCEDNTPSWNATTPRWWGNSSLDPAYCWFSPWNKQGYL